MNSTNGKQNSTATANCSHIIYLDINLKIIYKEISAHLAIDCHTDIKEIQCHHWITRNMCGFDKFLLLNIAEDKAN